MVLSDYCNRTSRKKLARHNEWFGRGDWGNAILHPWDSAEARRYYNIAVSLQNQIYPGVSNGTDESNAFRHGMASLLMSQYLGPDFATMFTDAHERYSNYPDGDNLMDLHNNHFMINLGTRLSILSPKEAVPVVQEAIQKGCLRTSPF